MSEEDTDNYQEVAMRSMSQGTGLMFYVNGELYRGEASIQFYYGRGTGDGRPVAVQFTNDVDPEAKVALVSLNKGKLRELEYEEGEKHWAVVSQEGDRFDW